MRNLLGSANKIKKNLVRSLVLCGFLLAFACSDNGCVDANDFGDYESTTFRIFANPQGDNCEFGNIDNAKVIADSGNYGSGLKNCITSGVGGSSPCVLASASSATDTESYKNCIKNCINACLANTSLNQVSWKSVGKKETIELKKGTEIYVRAIGNVNLGGIAAQSATTLQDNALKSPSLISYGNIENFSSTPASASVADNANSIIDSIFATSLVCDYNGKKYKSPISEGYVASLCLGKPGCDFSTLPTGNKEYELGQINPASTTANSLLTSLNSCPAGQTQTVSFSYSRSGSNRYFVDKNSNFIIQFSGNWTAGDSSLLQSTDLTVDDFNETPNMVNGARKILAYIQPVPDQYRSDPQYPSTPNPLTWHCTYNPNPQTDPNTDKSKLFECSTSRVNPDNYCHYYSSALDCGDASNTGAIANFNKNLSEFFKVDNSNEKDSINESLNYGSYGFIRYNNDYLKPNDYAYNAAASDSDNYFISFSDSGSSSKVFSFTPVNQNYAYKIDLRNVSGNNRCDNSVVKYNIKENGSIVYTQTFPLAAPFNIGQSQWNIETDDTKITLEKGQTIDIELKDAPPTNCTDKLVLRFLKYRDIEIAKSGFVRFAMIDDNGSGNGQLTTDPATSSSNYDYCRVKARIINPLQKRYLPASTTSENSDYFEYASATDPLYQDLDQILVYPTTRKDAAIHPYLKTTRPVFVRKGQIIRFDPVSWNGEWKSTYSTTDTPPTLSYNLIECGKGLVMITEPRPAVICYSKKFTDEIRNKNCTLKIPSDINSGCVRYSPTCDDQIGNSYCPIFCRASEADLDTCGAACGQLTSHPNAAAAPTSVTATTATATTATYQLPCDWQTYQDYNSSLGKCRQCAVDTKSVTPLTSPYKTRAGAAAYVKCLNFENYTGAVKTITNQILFSTSATPPTPQEILDEANCITRATSGGTSSTPNCDSKNLQLLEPFGGSYGSLDNFFSTKKLDPDTGSVILQTKNLTSSTSGILKFLIIHGDDFTSIANRDISSTNSHPYANNSGKIKLNIASDGNFKNGERLGVRLCKDTNSESLSCDSQSFATSSLNPKIITYDLSNQAATPSLSNSNYQFDQMGQLFRIKPLSTNNYECGTDDNDHVKTRIGSNFYCYKGDSEVPDQKQARLSFIIRDTDTLNCIIPTASQTSAGQACSATPCDGIKIQNPFYDSQRATANSWCDYAATQSDSFNCKKQFSCVSPSQNNSGFYDVEVKVKRPAIAQISGFINKIISPVIEILDSQKIDNPKTIRDEKLGLAEYLYKQLISDIRFKAILNIMVVLMVTFYGLGYFMGLNELKHADISNRLLKIGIIYLFTNPNSWYWFDIYFVQFFKDGVEYLTFMMASSFDNSDSLKQAIISGDYSDKSPLFYSVDRVLSLVLNETIHKKIIALLFHNFFGFIYLMVIYWSLILYVYAISNAVLIYLTAHFFTSIFFGIAPLFFIFLAFEKTKNYFDNWLNGLIGFGLQRIFLIFTLSMFNFIIYEVIKLTLSYRICWGEVWTINIGPEHLSLLSSWEPNSAPSYLRASMSEQTVNNSGSAPSIPMILSLWALCSLMLKFITYITGLAALLSSGISAVELGNGISSAMTKGIEKFNKTADEWWQNSGGKVLSRADNYLFQSGKIAKEERAKARKEIKEDFKMRQSMMKAGDKAVSDYKKDGDNLLKFANMSEKERQQELGKIREKAMKDHAKKMGISEKAADKLMKDKGVKYVGDNVFGLLKSALTQAVSSGGALFNSADSKLKDNNNTSLSLSQLNKAMKNMSPEDREKLNKNVKDGKLKVKKTNRDRFNEVAASIRKRTPGIGSIAKPMETLRNDMSNLRSNMKHAIGGALSKVANAAASALGVKAMASEVKEFRNNRKRYNEAEKQLVSEGKINKMRSGTANLGRTKKEKKMISDLAREKKFSEKDKEGNNSKDSDKKRVDNMEAYLNKKDEIKKDNIEDDGKIKQGGDRKIREEKDDNKVS